MPNMDNRSNHASNSPFVIAILLLGIVMVFATVAWLGARRETAALYGIIRSIEFPFVNRIVPHAEWFSLDALRAGAMPGLTMIYTNSLIYGLFFTAMILGVLMLALLRLDRFSIKPHIGIKSGKGRGHVEIMERLARNEPSIQFFIDYDMLDLPTNEGTARQPMRAIELLLYTDTIRQIKLDTRAAKPPTLTLDEDRLRHWMTARFGRENPFIAIPTRRLLDAGEVERAVDELSWYAVLVLYPALWRVHAFHVEGGDGFQTVQKGVETFIADTWKELNGFKKEFRDGIALGYASAADRAERDAFYRSNRAKPRKARRSRKPQEAEQDIAADTTLDAITDLGRVYRQGQMDRGETAAEATPRSSAGAASAKKPSPPEHLLIFGEVLSERGPGLACVAEARSRLKDILTRHLGAQRKSYPVGNDPKTGLMVYAGKLTTAEQKAFNTKAQERLSRAQRALEIVLWSHQFEFSLVGGAMETARRYGILPPNLFRWLRFCDETTAFWWFVQNLGMPSAYPENAGHFEHYQAEKAMGVPVERPYVQACLDGIKQEADRYLVPECVDELRTILGKDAIVTQVANPVAMDDLMDTVMEQLRHAAQGRDDGHPKGKPAERKSAVPRPAPAVQEAAPRRPATQDGLLSLFDLDE